MKLCIMSVRMEQALINTVKSASASVHLQERFHRQPLWDGQAELAQLAGHKAVSFTHISVAY